jgi:ferredoxin
VAYLEEYDAADLRDLLGRVSGREATQQLMVALAYLDGESVSSLARRYGLATGTVEEWLRRLDEEPVEDAVAGAERLSLSERARTPVGTTTAATVEYLDYAAVEERGWALEDPDLFERAAAAGLSPPTHGELTVEPGQSVLAAVGEAGLSWPHACGGGACSNCAVYVVDGEVAMSGDHVLPDEVVREGDVRLACVATPTTERVRLVYGVRHLDVLEDLLLPAEGFDVPAR